MNMATKPEILVTKEDLLVTLVTISVAILSPRMAINTMPELSLQPCKSKGLNWPFLHFSGGLP